MFHVNKGIVQVINPLHLLRFVPSSLCPVASAAVMPRASRAGSSGGINGALTQQGTTLGGFSSELAWGSPWCRVVQSRARGGCVSRDPHPSMGGPILAPSAPFPRTFSTPSKIIAPKNFKPQTQRPSLRASGCNNTRSTFILWAISSCNTSRDLSGSFNYARAFLSALVISEFLQAGGRSTAPMLLL